MARESNRGRGNRRSNRLHQRKDDNQDGTHEGAAPDMERDSKRSRTPPGGGGGPPGGSSLDGRASRDGKPTADDVTWWPGCGRKARTGDTVSNRGSRVTFGGIDSGRGRRCEVRAGGKLSASEVAAIAREARKGATVGARVVLTEAGANTGRTIPRDSGDRARAGYRFSRRAIGRWVCVGSMVRALVAGGHEPWASGVAKERARRRAEKKKRRS